jgi:cephalosporin hydroxylase
MNIEQVFNELDQWVSRLGTGTYYPKDVVQPPGGLKILPIFGIQQIREEILELCKIIQNQPWDLSSATCVEIGLGHFGSTHFLWRHLFKKTITIEKNHDRVNLFADNVYKYYNKWVLDDGKSDFVIGSSSDPATVEKVYVNNKQIDFLFIDGDHSYKSALTDWLIYEPLVRPNGIIAFHDSKSYNCDVHKLITELNNERFNKKYNLVDIVYSDGVGITYYIKN